MTNLIGYQEKIDWMGAEVLTLADVWPETPRAMIVGLNPAPTSVSVGHYYQGRTGQGQLTKLADAGLFARPRGRQFEEVALAAGIGFTDIVKRPSVGEKDVRSEEIRFGSNLLAKKLEEHDVKLIVCVFRHPVKVLLGREGSPGMQTQTTSWGAHVFRMPGPFAPRDEVRRVMQELTDFLD